MIHVTSTAFAEGSTIPRKYACDGRDINPPLTIHNIPESTQSLVLIMDDPDAPSRTWNHWLLWNISPQTTEIKEDQIPSNSVIGSNDFGKIRYNGPCPPGGGSHRYFFKIYALDQTLSLKKGSKRADLEKAMEGHILAQGHLMGTYSRFT